MKSIQRPTFEWSGLTIQPHHRCENLTLTGFSTYSDSFLLVNVLTVHVSRLTVAGWSTYHTTDGTTTWLQNMKGSGNLKKGIQSHWLQRFLRIVKQCLIDWKFDRTIAFRSSSTKHLMKTSRLKCNYHILLFLQTQYENNKHKYSQKYTYIIVQRMPSVYPLCRYSIRILTTYKDYKQTADGISSYHTCCLTNELLKVSAVIIHIVVPPPVTLWQQ